MEGEFNNLLYTCGKLKSSCRFSDIENKMLFVATKCDDISCSEAIRSLDIHGPQLDLLESQITDIRATIESMTSEKDHASKEFERGFYE